MEEELKRAMRHAGEYDSEEYHYYQRTEVMVESKKILNKRSNESQGSGDYEEETFTEKYTMVVKKDLTITKCGVVEGQEEKPAGFGGAARRRKAPASNKGLKRLKGPGRPKAIENSKALVLVRPKAKGPARPKAAGRLGPLRPQS